MSDDRNSVAAPSGPGSHPSDQAPAGLGASRVDPSRDEHRGWTISRGRWPEPAWFATGPGYDAWTEGEGEWADNGEKADAATRDALIAEIDQWIEDHRELTPVEVEKIDAAWEKHKAAGLDALAERFCRAPLPETVCADLCATKQGPGRTGTNLMSVAEAKQVLAFVLNTEGPSHV